MFDDDELTDEVQIVQQGLRSRNWNTRDLTWLERLVFEHVFEHQADIPRQFQLRQERENDLASMSFPDFIHSLGGNLLISSNGGVLVAYDDEEDDIFGVKYVVMKIASLTTHHVVGIMSDNETDYEFLDFWSETLVSSELLTSVLTMAAGCDSVTKIYLEVDHDDYLDLVIPRDQLGLIFEISGKTKTIAIHGQRLNGDHQEVLAAFQGHLELKFCVLEGGGQAFANAPRLALSSLLIEELNPFNDVLTFRGLLRRVAASAMSVLTMHGVDLSSQDYQLIAGEMPLLVGSNSLQEINLTDSNEEFLSDEELQTCKQILEQGFLRAQIAKITAQDATGLERLPFVPALQMFTRLMFLPHVPKLIDISGNTVQVTFPPGAFDSANVFSQAQEGLIDQLGSRYKVD